MTPGAGLFARVDAYAALGDHRTGTAADVATRAWVGGELAAAGAEVREVPYELDAWVPSWQLSAGGLPVESVPLWYSGSGHLHSARLTPVALTPTGTEVPDELSAAVARAKGLVVATTAGPTGSVIALNRAPAPPGDVGVLLAGSRDAERLASEPVVAELEARSERRASAIVVGRLGPQDRPLVVATPLTGWFGCAAERGTGIVAALELAVAFAESGVTFVGTTGHELGHLGVQHVLRSGLLDAPSAVVHVGASVAAGDGALGTFSPLRLALTTLEDPAERMSLGDLLEPAEMTVHRPLGPWPGEGHDWSGLGVPVLSFTGRFPEFHTPLDLPDRTTSPVLLERAISAVRDAVDRFRHLVDRADGLTG